MCIGGEQHDCLAEFVLIRTSQMIEMIHAETDGASTLPVCTV